MLGALLAGAPAAVCAQPAPPAAADQVEAHRLADDIAHGLYKNADWPALIGRWPGLSGMQTAFNFAPGWPELARQAMVEASPTVGQAMERQLAGKLAEQLSLDSLRAGAAFFAGPGGDFVSRSIAAGFTGQAPPSPGPEVTQSLQQLQTAPGGAAFLEKLGHTDELIGNMDSSVTRVFFADMMRRFSTKALAAEPPPPSVDPAALELGDELAAVAFDNYDVASAFRGGLGDLGDDPTLKPLFELAAADEFKDDGPGLRRAMGVVFAAHFTAPEMQAALAARATAGDGSLATLLFSPTPLPGAAQSAARALAASADGRDFLTAAAAMNNGGADPDPGLRYMVAYLMPRIFLRFADKLDAQPPPGR